MDRKMWLAAAVALAVAGSAEAQVFRGRTTSGTSPAPAAPSGTQYYVGPGGVLYAAPVPPAYVAPGVVQSADPCCPCPPGGSGRCKDDCTNQPRITYHPENCPPTQVCKPIGVTITPSPEPECVNIPFYGKPISSKQKVKVPVHYMECEEVIRFEDYTINLKCCSITVCVPCEVCQVKREKCVEQEREVAIEAYRRRDQTIDVYALNVPGLPTKYVLRLKMSEPDFKTAYPGLNPPTYP